MKPLPPLPPPLKPLPPAIEARIGVQLLAAHSWQRWELWADRLPPELWPDLALVAFMDGTGREFADWSRPSGTELRALDVELAPVGADIEQQEKTRR